VEQLFRDNIKVHFAGVEGIEKAFAASRIAGVRYFLFSAFPFIIKNFGIKYISEGFIKNKIENIPQAIQGISSHAIMDSGIFTLMFGAMKGKPISRQFIDQWQNELVNFVRATNFTGTCVEVDCQKILGVSDAWDLRKKLREQLPNNRIINVFHLPDGQRGLDRIIEFSNYIAISLPELRIVKPKTYRDDVHWLACYIKNRKPDIDIHLLGCTVKKILEQNKFCTSSDSTGWLKLNRYGLLSKGKGVKNENKEKMIQTYGDIAVEALEEIKGKVKISEERKIDFIRYGLAALYNRNKYTVYAGNQD
jgi:hypothetical protein